MSQRTSVIIPVRDGARFIDEAIRSALPQLAADDEVIVVDDASTDATRAILARVQDTRVRVLEGTGAGVSPARNIGLAAASGEFIAFLDHDDLWPPARHAVLLQALLADVAIDCAIGRLRLRMEHDAISVQRLANVDGALTPDITLCTGLFRRRILDLVGGFDEGMRFSEDTDYLLRLKEHGYRAALCDVDALIYRRHSTNATCDLAGAQDGVMQLIRRRRIRMAARTTSGR
jgi:glycosyltransferase involved in cell wall biosynthesis